MKLIISALLLLGSQAGARADIIRISFEEENRAMAVKIQEQMEKEFFIPKEFITMLETRDPCEKSREMIQWHLCINRNGNLDEVSVEKTFKNETLKVFL